jgi:hypothetical protein
MEREREAARRRELPSWLASLGALALVVGTLLATGAVVDRGGSTTVVATELAGSSDTTGTTHGEHDDERAASGDHDAHGDDATTATTHAGAHDTHDPDGSQAGDAHGHGTTQVASGPVTHAHDTSTGTTVPGHDHDPTTATTTPGHDHTPPSTGTTGTTVPHDHDPDPEPGELSPLTLAEIQVARDIAAQYPTAADATAAGWQKITIHLPGIAAHYLRFAWLDGTFELAKPEVLLYGGEGPDAPIVGVNYIVSGSSPPEGFTGDADHWHEHPTLCMNSTIGLIVGDESETPESCAAKGGSIISFAGNWLLHVWCVPGWESPEGIFSHENSKVV